ncbi:hypothetical protein OE88DRAFT_1527669 [Heliocybe sulcata]|uniref:Uncharacterized protein n=1 Tax=Heliocybe sulcata TaxID=5364 RepID=A0A5C3N570_9AGAM|nr:hypothetical protein OE88DRAFT_1527669 [Heliocybe sulcata]
MAKSNVNRDSNMVRASILNTALELGVGRNRTVTNWMFNGIDEEDEEEESMSPALTSASTASDNSVGTPQMSSGAFAYPGPAGRVPPLTTKPTPRVEFDLTRPPPTPDTVSPVPVSAPTNQGFLKSRFGRSKSKRDDGYETDGATTDTGSKKKNNKKGKPSGEGHETDGDGGKSKKKNKKKKEDGEESDGGYLSDFTRRRKKDKKPKASPSPGEESDGGYLSEASSKKMKSFFRMNGRSGSGSKNPPPVPSLPDLQGLPPLPIAGKFADSRSGTPLSKDSIDGSDLRKVFSNDSLSSNLETTTQEDASIGHWSERDKRSLESQPGESPRREYPRRLRFRLGSSDSIPSSQDSRDTGKPLPALSLPNSRNMSPMPSPGGVSPAPAEQQAALHRPIPLNLSIPSGSNVRQGRRLSPKSLGSEYAFIQPGLAPDRSHTLPVSPAPSDYSLVPSVPGAEYTNPSPLPSPRPLTPSHHDMPPPTPPPHGPLPDVPPQQVEIQAPKASAAPPSSFLDFEAQSPPTSRSTSPLYAQGIPTIQRGRESPFPAKPLLPPEDRELIQRARSPNGRSASAMGYYSRPSERVRRGQNLSEDGLDYLIAGRPGPMVRSPSAIARMRPEVSASPEVMSGINISVEQASEEADVEERAELDSVLSRFRNGGEERGQEVEPSIPAGAVKTVLSPGLRSPNSYRNSQRQPRIIKGRDPGYELEEDEEEEPEEYGEIEDEVIEDDDKSYYPEEDKTAGRSTFYMLENGEEDLRYSMYTDGDRTSRGSFLNEDKSWDARERFMRRVAALYEETGREKPPPVPKLDPKLKAKFGG